MYVDGVEVYAGRKDQPHFDVNSLGPSQIEGVEYYAEAAQAPAQYSPGLESGCGVLLLWTRISR